MSWPKSPSRESSYQQQQQQPTGVRRTVTVLLSNTDDWRDNLTKSSGYWWKHDRNRPRYCPSFDLFPFSEFSPSFIPFYLFVSYYLGEEKSRVIEAVGRFRTFRLKQSKKSGRQNSIHLRRGSWSRDATGMRSLFFFRWMRPICRVDCNIAVLAWSTVYRLSSRVYRVVFGVVARGPSSSTKTKTQMKRWKSEKCNKKKRIMAK